MRCSSALAAGSKLERAVEPDSPLFSFVACVLRERYTTSLDDVAAI